MLRRRIRTKKLLVATIGLATATFSSCSKESAPGNLMAPPDDPPAAGNAKDGEASPDEAAADGDKVKKPPSGSGK